MDAVSVTRSVNLASPPDRVWPLLSDTDRFNRLLGLHEVKYRPVDASNKTGACFVGETRAGGFRLTYDEFPFEWSRPRAFSVHRRMHGGPIASFTWRCTLVASRAGDGDGALEGGTRATLRLELVPRAFVLRPVAWLNASRVAASFVELGASIDEHVAKGTTTPYSEPVSASDGPRIETAVARLCSEGIDARLAARLGSLVRDGADADVARIRPLEQADLWGEDRRATLAAFLRAVPAGLLEMRWGLVCPSCLTSSQESSGLDDIGADAHCHLCDITYELDLDRAVEATFKPHPSLRRLPDTLFCMGGPARTPHVLVQALVNTGIPATLEVPREAGRYRLFARGGATATVEVDASAPDAVDVTLDAAGLHPAHIPAAPGGTVRLTSRLDPRHVKIERLGFASAAATAHMVSTLSEFRTLFAKDLLKRGTPLKVARAALLFSDLTGSTALYTKVGDAAAFRLVDDHFDVMRAIVASHDGVVVKTMGDAVMAAFVDERSCALAALDALQRFEAFRLAQSHGEHVGIKLGLYAGACYVVTANGALDYFGQTVNVASRVQHLASSGEAVLPSEVHAALEAEVHAALEIVERFEARVKGVEEPLALVRVRRKA
ncbi:MAG: adenylate/guanylate cyclase domain-containing protein [Polyangiaceae bacterium]